MATETVKISGNETSQKIDTTEETRATKSGKSNKCMQCGIHTYQKDGMCVLCKTGITQIYEVIESLRTAKAEGK